MPSNTLRYTLCALLLSSAGCGNKSEDAPTKGDEPEQAETSASKKKDEAAPPNEDTPKALAEKVGVEPGAIEPEEGEAAAAMIAAHSGDIEVKRLGEELFSKAEGEDTKLYPGDEVRAGTGAAATVAFADESTAELAEGAVLAVGDRNATADPASSAALLYGIARFSVSERAEGEGPFVVYTPSGVVGTKGTVFGVAVAATGSVRVGVEDGEVEVAGGAKLDAAVDVSAGKAVVVAPAGEVAAPIEFAEDDWSEWQDSSEAESDVTQLAEAHVSALGTVETEVETGYETLNELATAVAAADEKAASAQADGQAEVYAEVAPNVGVDVEAAYLAAARLQYLSYKMAAHAYLAQELEIRHPDSAAKIVIKAKPRIHRSVLYQKKFHLVAGSALRPLRPAYYVHHPRGRLRAKAVGFAVPGFYADVKLKPVDAKRAIKRAGAVVYVPPRKFKRGKKRRLRVGGPTLGWYAGAKVRIKPAAPRAKVGWYRPAKARRAKLIAGAKVRAKIKPRFKVGVRAPRGRSKVRFGPRGGIRVRSAGGVRVKAPGVRIKGGGVGVKGPGAVRVNGRGGKIQIKTPGSRVRIKSPPGARGGAKVRIKGPGGKKRRQLGTKKGGRIRVKGKAGIKIGD